MPSPLQSSSAPRSVKGKVWADGRCGWAEERESRVNPLDDFSATHKPSTEEQFEAAFHEAFPLAREIQLEEMGNALGLSSAANSHRNEESRVPRGSGGLTSHGKKVVFNSCEFLQWRFGRRNLSFTTVTLPGVPDEVGRAIVKEWSQIVRIFVQNLRRKLNAKGLPDWIVGATEIQEGRGGSSAFAPLHLHLVHVARNPGKHWALTPRAVREAWRSAIVSRVPSASDFDYSATENLQQIKKGASSYMSKYVSKGRRDVGDVANNDHRWELPRSWYTCTVHLSRLVRGCVRSGRAVGAVLSRLSEEHFSYRRRIEIVGRDGLSFTVGWAGLLKKGWKKLIGISTYQPPTEYLYLSSKFCVPRIPHDGYDYLFSNHPSIHQSDSVPVHPSVALTVPELAGLDGRDTMTRVYTH